ncbi:MAG TPA: efflux RND transporter periplasmic adaptor subunit [Planctomycetota bacterium]|nr:efflux RND transporter periplasmic adaptor subunit [Planctomycetota bacterium]
MKWMIPVGFAAAVGGVGLVLARPAAAPPAASDQEGPYTVKEARIDIPDAAAKRMGLETLTIVASDEPVTLRLTGRTALNMEHVAHVKAQFPGKIVDLGPQLGSQVQGPDPSGEAKATPLCVIESVDLANAKSTYLKAKVQLTLDQDTLRRTAELVSTKVLADKFLLDAQASVTKDEADLHAARQNLLVFGLKNEEIEQVEKQEGRERMVYTILSPCSGTIAEKNVTRGELADPTVNLFTIADTSTLWVWGDVYERDWQQVRVGQKIRIRIAAFPSLPVECTVDFISPQLDAATRSIRIRGTIDNRDRRLLADMYGTLLVTVDEGKNSIIVPAEAVVRKLQSSYAFVRTKGPSEGKAGSFEKREVVVETVDQDRLRVVKGLATGDVVASRGTLGLYQEMER